MNLFLALLLIQSAFAEINPCDSSKDIASFRSKSGIQIVVCGLRENGQLYDLKVLRIQGHDTTPLFNSDDAFKSYQLTQDSESITILESLNEKGSAPFLKLSVHCEKTTCKMLESCVWKKSKPNEKTIAAIEKLLSKKQGVSIDLWNQAFYSMLNGSLKARQLFESQSNKNSDASGSEAFETYKADFLRLKSAKCL
jgi:hypothetical protein